ncbi:MAG: 30S ribosomal protein S18 [Clostridia bacterium]|nr:30S ribosomal protein S18 [Clostridia bacterium]
MAEIKEEVAVAKETAPKEYTKSNETKDFERPRRFNKKIGRKKVCTFCVEKAKEIDYKDVAKLKHFVTEKGKILPRRQTGTCSAHQRMIATAVKRARIMALLPFQAK